MANFNIILELKMLENKLLLCYEEVDFIIKNFVINYINVILDYYFGEDPEKVLNFIIFEVLEEKFIFY